jgi:hypothetical protein
VVAGSNPVSPTSRNRFTEVLSRASRDARSTGGGLGEYYSEHETRTPVRVCARFVPEVGLSLSDRAAECQTCGRLTTTAVR